jgi:hypothetical protein
MTIPSNREYLDSGDGSGCRVRGLARQVINGEGTTKQLTASESGALCVFGNAAGQTYTLPAIGANDVGMFFDFTVTVTATSNGYSVDTDSASTFIGGGILEVDDGGGGTESFLGDIAAHVSIDLDSAVTGQQIGGYFRALSVSTTVWTVGGYAVGVGTMETPFA